MGWNKIAKKESSPILVGILVIDRPKTTEKCLQQLFKHTNRNDYVLCVVDNNSNAQTKEVLQKYRKEIDILIENQWNHGCAFSVNQYMSYRKPGQHVLDINVDAHIIVDDWLPLMLKIIDYPDIGIASGKRPDLWYDQERWPYYKQCIEILERDGIYLEWDAIHNSIIYPWAMMKSELIDEIGYMNERTGIDDINYCVRTAKVGKKCVYIPNVVILQPQNEEQYHPEYKANRAMVMQHWAEHTSQASINTVKDVYCGSRFVPGSISDPTYQRASDDNFNFFKTWQVNHGME